MNSAATVDQNTPAPEEYGRRACYSFLASVLYGAPKPEHITTARSFAEADTDLGRAFSGFVSAIENADPKSVGEEYHDLFIGVGRGELTPFASVYLTGFLNEKPLAELRHDLDELGFERAFGVSEPEDHIATLCDVMGHMVQGTWEDEFTLYEQDQFFARHLKPWADKFFADLTTAKKADVYRHIGEIGRAFMAIEQEGFTMIARA